MLKKKTKFRKLWDKIKLISKIKKWYNVYLSFAGKEENKIYAEAFDKIKAIVEGETKFEVTESTARNMAYIFANVESTDELAFVVMKYKEAVGGAADADTTD